ncbi:MAG: hypothetical protein H6606_10005 [Flavobacteriales bacterium]|nr:hypothetical protein [Flavobacteriales bacterium]
MIIRRPVISLFLCFLSLTVFGQRNALSPYTFSGIGQLTPRVFAEQAFMGNISGTLGDESNFALLNPATTAHLRYTSMMMGVNYELVKQETATESQRFDNGKLNYFALGIPLRDNGGLGFNVGLTPLSEVGYFLQNQQLEDSVDVLNTFEGTGGLNAFNFGLGVRVLPGLAVGVNADFIFGNIVNIRDKQFIDNTNIFNYSDRIDATYTGLKWNLGVQYTSQNKGAVRHRLAATFSPESDLNALSDRLVTSYNSKGNTAFLIDSVLYEPEYEQTLRLPVAFSLGYGIGNWEKWLVSVEYSSKAYSNFRDIRGGLNYRDHKMMSFGGYFQPRTVDEVNRVRNVSDLFQVVRWYAGVSYTNLYLDQFEEPVNELGIGFGLGLPVIRKYRTPDGQSLKIVSRVNLGVEYKERGTISSGMLREQFTEIRVGVSFSDKWFITRKYQ